MLVAAQAAHPKSSHDVDAMPAGIFGCPVVSLRFLLRAGTRGRFINGDLNDESLNEFLRPLDSWNGRGAELKLRRIVDEHCARSNPMRL
jgi:hypothetical protein